MKQPQRDRPNENSINLDSTWRFADEIHEASERSLHARVQVLADLSIINNTTETRLVKLITATRRYLSVGRWENHTQVCYHEATYENKRESRTKRVGQYPHFCMK